MRGTFRVSRVLVIALIAAFTLAGGAVAQDEDDDLLVDENGQPIEQAPGDPDDFPIGEPVSEPPDPNLPIDESPEGEASGADAQVNGTQVEVVVYEGHPTGGASADPDPSQPVDEGPLVDENGEPIPQAPGDPDDFPIGEPVSEDPDPNLPIDESPDSGDDESGSTDSVETTMSGAGAPSAAGAPLSATA